MPTLHSLQDMLVNVSERILHQDVTIINEVTKYSEHAHILVEEML